MSLHHRCGSRIPLVLDVDIKHMGKKLGTSCTRNINPYGVFIELPSDQLEVNDFVEMHFKDKQKNDSFLLQKGLVRHQGTDGIGVLFAYDKKEFRAML
ncbi:MAG: hypothetical protein ACI808_001400, partial [Paraglaciecola sp.]